MEKPKLCVGALIADLEELHRWALERIKTVNDEKLKK